MATACGPQAISFDQPQHVAVRDLPQAGAMEMNPQESSRTTGPPPNPPFIFPARSSPSLAPICHSGVSRQRPKSAIEPGDRHLSLGDDSDSSSSRSPALPPFCFNPGNHLGPDTPMLSPPTSPGSPMSIPPRANAHGHRRGGSEYVGGTIRGGDAISIMSNSPTKSESDFASPTFAPPRPAGRRGHAHRRSAAISSHDLSLITKPPASTPVLRGNSAPNSPVNTDPISLTATSEAAAATEKKNSRVENPEQPLEPQDRSESGTSSLSKPPSRVRVGFSDNIEYIPRPVSLVSSDTSSTITAKPGHSVSGSISSIVSAQISTSMDGEASAPAQTPSPRTANSRPSTAGAILERSLNIEAAPTITTNVIRRNSTPHLLSLDGSSPKSPSDSSPTKTSKRWSFFGLEPFIIGNSSPRGSRPASPSSSSASSSKHDGSSNSSADNIGELPRGDGDQGRKKSSGKKSRNKQKKVKTWAGSILKTRRPKTKRNKSKVITPMPTADFAPITPNATDEHAAQAVPPPSAAAAAMPVVMVTESSPSMNDSEAPKIVRVYEDDGSFPVIDLDAALGPFNTPVPYNAEWEAAQRAGTSPRRKLHSAAGMSHFSGPGGHYHRRAESAPEMAPFEHGHSGIHRFGSSSTMADVFEEEEEEEDESNQVKKNREAKSNAVTESFVFADSSLNGISSQTVPDSSSQYLRITNRLHYRAKFDSQKSGNDLKIASPFVIEDGSVPRSTAPDDAMVEMPPPPCDHSDSADSSPRRLVPIRDLAPVDVSIQLPTASLGPTSPLSIAHSSFSSPRSPVSYEANRVSTDPSSVAEENTFYSLLMGEPGPEVRHSIDGDIPSLTSTNSTMTKDSSFVPQVLPSHGNLPGQRPASFSSAAFNRRRSSLASIGRLISSSHGEKSKLSMEVTCDSVSEKKPKNSKAKRLSRKLQFWKSAKEASSTTT